MATDDSGDLKDFIRWHTAQSDRRFRELLAKSDRRWQETERVIERNTRAFDKLLVETADQRDERQALVDAVLRLNDATNRLGGPGGATA